MDEVSPTNSSGEGTSIARVLLFTSCPSKNTAVGCTSFLSNKYFYLKHPSVRCRNLCRSNFSLDQHVRQGSSHVEPREGDVVGAGAKLRLHVGLLQVDRGVFPLLQDALQHIAGLCHVFFHLLPFVRERTKIKTQYARISFVSG